ncbi:unnamed protein product, partial [Effrenium voratum]
MFLKGHLCAGHVAILFLQERRGRSGAGARVQRDVAGHDHHDVAGQGPSLAARGLRAPERCRYRYHPGSVPMPFQQ